MSFSNTLPAAHAAPLDLSILLPQYSEIQLPSAGWYGNTPVKINVRGMTVRELKQLTTGRHLTGRAIDTILRACVKEQIDLSSLLNVDYNVIALSIRLATQSADTTGMHVCEHCHNKFKVSYDLADVVRVQYASETIPVTRMVHMDRISDLLGRNVEFEVKPLTRGDFLKMEATLSDARERANKTGEAINKFPMEELFKAQIKAIHGLEAVPLPPDVIVNYLNEDDAEAVVSAFENIGAGVSGSVDCSCPSCGSKTVYEVPFTDLFFR